MQRSLLRRAPLALLVVAWLFVSTCAATDATRRTTTQTQQNSRAVAQSLLAESQRGDSDSMYRLAQMYQDGVGVDADASVAFHWLRQAALAGHIAAQSKLGDAYFLGNGVIENRQEALHWRQRAADQGAPQSQYALAGMYQSGNAVAKNEDLAKHWYFLAADKGYVPAQKMLAALYLAGLGPKYQPHDAFLWLRRAAETDPTSQWMVANLYISGIGVDKDDVQALFWTRRAAENGMAPAQNNLAEAYLQGAGVNRDDKEALKWLKKSAIQNNAIGQQRLGALYATGRGTSVDLREAFKWFNKAADNGDNFGLLQTGGAYLLGRGVPKDVNEGLRLIRQSAESGHPMAQNLLGLLHDNGEVLPQNPVLAYMYYNLGAAQGNKDAAHGKAKVAEMLTPSQLAEAQILSTQWRVGTSLPTTTSTYRTKVPESVAVSVTPVNCNAISNTLTCEARCVHGKCSVTFENGCKKFVEVAPKFNSFKSEWEYPSPCSASSNSS